MDKIKFIKDSNLDTNVLIDFNYLCYRAFFHKDVNENNVFHPDLWRHIIFTGILKAINLFNPKNVYIVGDTESWRKTYFPYYKYKRKVERDKNKDKFNMLYNELNKFWNEIKKNFPYYVVRLDRCEADDIIAIFCKFNQENCINVLLSSDKDFMQLYKYSNFFQYDPIAEGIKDTADWNYDLFYLCIKGDDSDGIPSILSGDNYLADKIRQKPIRETKIKQWFDEAKEGKNFCENDIQVKNFKRNCKLIRFDMIPKDISRSIVVKLSKLEKYGDKSKMFSYFASKKMSYLLGELESGRI